MEQQQSNEENRDADSITGYHDEIRRIQLEGMHLGVKKARNALFLTAGLTLVWEVVGIAQAGVGLDIYSGLLIALIVGIYIALGFWTKKKPYTAIIVGLIVFILYWILAIIVNGMADGGTGAVKGIFGGIIFKIAILVALIRPLKDAKELQEEQHKA